MQVISFLTVRLARVEVGFPLPICPVRMVVVLEVPLDDFEMVEDAGINQICPSPPTSVSPWSISDDVFAANQLWKVGF